MRAYTYTYDPLGRLEQVTKDGALLREYTYDTFSNRTNQKDYQKGITSAYAYDALNRLTRKHAFAEENQKGTDVQTIYTYDQRGNLTEEWEDGNLLHRYTYGATNRLTKASDETGREARYHYNGLGQRVGRNESGKETSYLLDLTKPYHNLLSTIGEDRTQTYYFDGNVAALEEKGSYHYYFQDELGSPLRVSGYGSREDTEMERNEPNHYLTYGYDEFGGDLGKDLDKDLREAGIPNPYAVQGQEQPFGYTGYRYDGVSGTYFAQAREYVPTLGRFTAEDVLKGNGAIPETLNRYGYCRENPLLFIDRNGMFLEVIAVSAITAVVTAAVTSAVVSYVEDAKAVYEQQRVDVPAPVMPTDTNGLEDYTEVIDAWLFQKENLFQEIKNEKIEQMMTTGTISAQRMVIIEQEVMSIFIKQVKTDGEMDIKQPDKWETAFHVSMDDYFIYHGEIMDKGTLGNITFGYVGASLYPDFMLYYGGGVVNMKGLGWQYIPAVFLLPNYGDSPEDIEAIRKGIEMWNERNECIDG